MRILPATLLFLATTSAAVLAEPARDETTARVRYDDRAPPPVEPVAKAEGGWIELASATPASHGRELISVDASAGAMAQLRFTAASGRPYISAVRIEFKDKTHKAFEIDKVAAVGRRPIVVDLHGARELEQVVVVTDRTSSGSYVVEASAGNAGLASR